MATNPDVFKSLNNVIRKLDKTDSSVNEKFQYLQACLTLLARRGV